MHLISTDPVSSAFDRIRFRIKSIDMAKRTLFGRMTGSKRRRGPRWIFCALVVPGCLAPLGAIPGQRGELKIPTVAVARPGNPADRDGYGRVDTVYRIGKFEITNAQYTVFLNAVAAHDTYGLFNPSMESDPVGGIRRRGTSNGYVYSVKPNFDAKPVVAVSYLDAVRFVNWLENGQPAGRQGESTTENGAYRIGENGSVGARNPEATWFLPNEHEWFKAAYYDPWRRAEGEDAYWNFATRSDRAPGVVRSDSLGEVSNAGPNLANYQFGADWNGRNGNVITVGSAGEESTSGFGTFDQSGNVFEWVESRSGTGVIRGGGWDSASASLSRIVRYEAEVEAENTDTGFRVARREDPNNENDEADDRVNAKD